MKFDINKYKGKYAMHCKSREEAENFCIYMKEYCSNANYQPEWYGVYKERTAYNLGSCDYCRVRWYMENGYTILEWSDFMNNTFTKADLKTGDVILRRNGNVEIYNGELGTFICKNGYNDVLYLRHDLTHPGGDEFDVVAVRRPHNKWDCQFDTFDFERGTLVYERKEVEEMTLAEVCKLLGKEIKIIQ